MNEGPDSRPEPHPDPEIEALLDFEPVVRRCVRHDGWLPAKQREFIVALTVLGHAQQAAIAVGGTMSGVYKLRTAEGGEGFAAAWDSALALHHRRHPRPEPRGRPSRGEIEAGTGRRPWPRAGSSPPPESHEPEPSEEEQWQELCDDIFRPYVLKLDAEREARLAGRIVEADFYVRQLTGLEVALDLAGHGAQAVELLKGLKGGGRHAGAIVATPVSLILDQLRRSYWAEEGGPERPPGPRLGPLQVDEYSSGEPLECQTAGLTEAERGRQERNLALRAEAQLLWERKAKADAQAWRERVEAEGSGDAVNAEETKGPR